MKRIAIIGSPGAGKSTLAWQLGEILGLPVFHLDRLFWKPGWIPSPKSLWIAMQSTLVTRDSWIIDGNYGSTLHIRVEAADTIIFLDFPRYICLGQAVKRAWQIEALFGLIWRRDVLKKSIGNSSNTSGDFHSKAENSIPVAPCLSTGGISNTIDRTTANNPVY